MITDIKELKELRERYKITQAELADVVGLHPSSIARIEAGKLDCRLSTIKLLNEGIESIHKSRNTGLIIKNETDFKNTSYRAMIEELERLEHDGMYKGNGHHLAQRLVEMLYNEFKEAKND